MDMTEAPAPAVAHVAKCYGVSTQYFHRLAALEKIARDDWMEPDLIFGHLLDRRHSPLRRKLASPAVRQAIRKNLHKPTP